MKKIVYAVLATVAGLVLLFSYRTSLDAVTPVATGATAAKSTSTGSSSTGSGSSTQGSGSSTQGSGSSGSSGSGSTTQVPGSSASSGAGSSTSGSSSGTGATSGSGSSSGAVPSSSLKDGTFTGQSADTRYGAVQVAITISGGRISHVSVPQYPNSGGRDQEINAQALPQLISDTESAQSAQIDMVSGATYTSDGYTRSLQSAIDQAKG